MPTAPPSALEIRPLVFAELDALLALYAQLHLGDPPLPAARATELWQTILAERALIHLGGFVSGALVSTCHAVIVPNLTRGGRPYAVIENVVTDAAWRRRGVGRAVIAALVERCWERGCYKVMLQSGLQRAADAHAFYEAVGFDPRAKQAFVIRRP